MSDETRETVQAERVQVQRVMPQDQTAIHAQAVGASKGLAQMFGLDIRAAILVTLVDVMIFGVDVLSVGAFVVMGVVIAGVLGAIVYKIQKRWFGDDHESALIKALIVGLLTAIPAPLTPLVAVPCGILGAVQMVRRR